MLTPAALGQLQRSYGSADWSQWQNYRWQQYDYVRYPAAGAAQLQFFTVGLGGADPNASTVPKTLEQTNLTASGQFGQVGMLIAQIRLHARILPKGRQAAGIANDADVLWTTYTNMMSKYLELLRRGVLSISIQSKEYFTISEPLRTCPPGFGVEIQQHASSYIAAAGAWTTFSAWVQQNPDADNIFNVDPPQYIEPAQTFTAQITYPDGTGPVFTNLVSAASPALDIGLIFDGYIVRPLT
jgi:hypothetical protein